MESPTSLDSKLDLFKKQFAHFDTNEECDEFINYIQFMNIQINHKCCNGLGCCIRNINFEDLTKVVKEYKLFKNENQTKTKKENALN